MPRLSKTSLDKLRDMRDITDRYGRSPPIPPVATPAGDKPPFLIGRIDSGPDEDGRYTGRLVRYYVYTQEWINASEWDVKFAPANDDDTPPVVGRRYPCRPSHIEVQEDDTYEYVYNLFTGGSGGGRTFVIIDDNMGTGTENLQGRAVGRIATYNVSSDSWSYSDNSILVEPINSGTEFVAGVIYPAWYAGEDTGGFDGTGTGTLGTGTSSTVPVYLAEADVFKEVLVDVECVGGSLVKTYETIRVRGYL